MALREKPGKFTIVTTIVIATGEDLNNISSSLPFFSSSTTGKKVRERNCRLADVVEPYSRLKLPFTLELSAKRRKAASGKTN